MDLFYRNNKAKLRLAAGCTAIAMLFGAIPYVSAAPVTNGAADAVAAADGDATAGYAAYLERYADAHFSADSITVALDATLSSENPTAKAVFTVREEGLYHICLRYTPIACTGQDIRLAVRIDGASPYEELENLSFSRLWVDAADYHTEIGDESRPKQVEVFQENVRWAKNALGLYEKPYAVYLMAGEHELALECTAEAIKVSSITFADRDADIPDYADYLAEQDKRAAGRSIVIEAEDAFLKSDRTLAPTADMTNAGMSPVSAERRLINSFGKEYWTTNGQWASWRVPDDAESGLYTIAFRAKQNGTVGTTTFRRLTVNGTCPFTEAEHIAFPYAANWQNVTFGEKDGYRIWLSPGDVITLEATTGPMAGALSTIYSAVDRLNEIYQSIIMIAGTEPDSERDYNIQKEIPTLLDDLDATERMVREIADQINQVMGDKNPKIFLLKRMEKALERYRQDPTQIVPNLSELKSYIDSFAAQTYDFSSLPLELDRIYLLAEGEKAPAAAAGFWQTVRFELDRFICSFTDDYASVKSDAAKDTVTVWCALGRDQLQAVKQIIDDDFIPSTGINVELKAVTTTLAEAILAGCEPDVSLSVTQEVPVDLALRGQALDLAPYLEKTDSSFKEQFYAAAWVPFTYRGGIYAIPLTQDFSMLFYRADIFARLGLSVPDDWTAFYDVLQELQKNSFQVGIREANSTNAGVSSGTGFFETLLLQQGTSYFNDDLTAVNFDSDGAKTAFMQWVRLYRDYDLDTDFDQTSRFRSGEMPLILTSYGFYQQIAVIAPEISGRWAIAPVPGTRRADGTLDRTVSSTMTGTMILRSAERRGKADTAFRFVTWWASEQAQVGNADAMQVLQGVAGRPMVANRQAFSRLGWTAAEQQVIRQQWDQAGAIAQVPGTYIIARSLTNALRTSYGGNVDALRQLGIQTRLINEELARKRAEFERNE